MVKSRNQFNSDMHLSSSTHTASLEVFAYPCEMVQSMISSRLENDPLPLLSALIDNMHVVQVQRDICCAEAVLEGGEVETL